MTFICEFENKVNRAINDITSESDIVYWWVYIIFETGCQSGVYGNYCAIQCPINCKENRCHIQRGLCFACQPGWNGDLCNISIEFIVWHSIV